MVVSYFDLSQLNISMSSWSTFSSRPKQRRESKLGLGGGYGDDDSDRDRNDDDDDDDDGPLSSLPQITPLSSIAVIAQRDITPQHHPLTSIAVIPQNEIKQTLRDTRLLIESAKKRQRARSRSPQRQRSPPRRRRSPSPPPPPPPPPRPSLSLDDDDHKDNGDDDDNDEDEEKKEAAEEVAAAEAAREEEKKGQDEYYRWHETSRQYDVLTRPGASSFGNNERKSAIAGGDDGGENADPAEFGLVDISRVKMQPRPIPNTGPPDISNLPLAIRIKEIAASKEEEWCFLCEYKCDRASPITHEYFGNSYSNLIDFIDNNRDSMAREAYYQRIQSTYDTGCRKALSKPSDRDRYWSIISIYKHLDGGHDRTYRNTVNIAYNGMFNLQMHMMQRGVCFRDTETGADVIDVKAAKLYKETVRETLKIGALREQLAMPIRR